MESRAMHKCAVFLIAVIAFRHLVFLVEGRQLKSMSSNDSKQNSKTDNFAMSKEDHQLEAPSYIPNAANSISGKKEVLLPAVPTKSSEFGHSLTGYKDDYRPTTPGHSPGVGHSFGEDDEDIQKPGSISPTTPGHSPGVGHSFGEDDEDIVQKPGSISSSNDKHTIEGEKEGFRATNPGHSPGVGHAFPNETSEPNA